MIWSYILSGLGIITMLLTGRKLAIGWLVGLTNSVLWIIYALTTGNYGFIISSLVFIVVQIRNYLAWTKPTDLQ